MASVYGKKLNAVIDARGSASWTICSGSKLQEKARHRDRRVGGQFREDGRHDDASRECDVIKKGVY
jgi:hypothetical protein